MAVELRRDRPQVVDEEPLRELRRVRLVEADVEERHRRREREPELRRQERRAAPRARRERGEIDGRVVDARRKERRHRIRRAARRRRRHERPRALRAARRDAGRCERERRARGGDAGDAGPEQALAVEEQAVRPLQERLDHRDRVEAQAPREHDADPRRQQVQVLGSHLQRHPEQRHLHLYRVQHRLFAHPQDLCEAIAAEDAPEDADASVTEADVPEDESHLRREQDDLVDVEFNGPAATSSLLPLLLV
mmetsp:Transcript_8766/g.25014  ORF Transcript_8766/g.25014 Transcript_8766/m.25014 type:complete len:250 (+) Transcript_8766:336-1085(+)